MNARDELRIKLLQLGGTISACWPDRGGKFDQVKAEGAVDATVDAILAAGYRKPRTITTAEELDALFQGDANVVLLDEDGISLQNLAGGWHAATGSRRLMTSDLAFHCFGPKFTVLHEEEVS